LGVPVTTTDDDRPEPHDTVAVTAEPAPPRAMLFDLDGTLVDTVSLRVECWIVAFHEVGVQSDAAELAGLMGADGKRVAREIAERHGRPLTDHRAELVDRRAGQLFGERNTQPRPLPFVRDLLVALTQARIPWSIATSSRPEQTVASVSALDLPTPPRIVDASHVTHAKPAPDLLLAGAEQLGVTSRDCWYVGDSTWDMIAARSAMMPGVGVPTGATDERTLRQSGALLVVADMGELHRLLQQRSVLPA
jgi:HAD superfamily hydrolase (TIGR01509 family)